MQRKPGDWSCGCGTNNFASRQAFFKCGASKPRSGGAQGVMSQTKKPGDWECSCGTNNFASRDACFKCGKAKGYPAVTKKPGDWNCPNCGDLVFASKDACRKCGASRPGRDASTPSATPQPPKQQPGDWVCGADGELNFGSRAACRKCGAARPAVNSPSASQAGGTESECVVCFEGPAEVAVVVCGHLSMCRKCAAQLSSCPICRATYGQDQLLKVYAA